MASLAERTREAVRRRPALRTALAAGAVNHTAAARLLAGAVGAAGDDVEAVAAALRRYGETLSLDRTDAGGSVRMVTGVGLTDDGDGDGDGAGAGGETLLAVGDRAVVDGGGSLTALVVEGGTPGSDALAAVLARLDAEGLAVEAAGTCDGAAVVVVGRRDAPDALRAVEDALGSVPRVTE